MTGRAFNRLPPPAVISGRIFKLSGLELGLMRRRYLSIDIEIKKWVECDMGLLFRSRVVYDEAVVTLRRNMTLRLMSHALYVAPLSHTVMYRSFASYKGSTQTVPRKSSYTDARV